MKTVVLRHRKENLKKCSLRGLEGRSDFTFLTYPKDLIPSLDGFLLLTLEAPPLTPADGQYNLFVLDATWRYAEVMYKQVSRHGGFIARSIPPSYRTAYPRRQCGCVAPERGLASVEAIFAAYHILGWPTVGLLDTYHWREPFFAANGLCASE